MNIITLLILLGFLSIIIKKLYVDHSDISFDFKLHRVNIKWAKTQKRLNEIEGDMLNTKGKLYLPWHFREYEEIRETLIDKKSELMDNGQYL